MERFVGRFKQLAWFLPGFLLWAAFPPMGERMDVLFALAPLMVVARKGDARKSARRWFQSGIFFWVATLSWMPAIVKNNGPWPLVVLGWFALAAYCAAYFAAYGWLSARYWRWARDGGWARRLAGVLFAEPVLWCGLELIRSRFLGGFAWNQLGVVAANSGFGGPAALGGVYLLSAAVVLVNGTVAGIAERVIASVRARMGRSHDAAALARWRSLETLMAFALIWGVYGAARAEREARAAAADARTVKVALVQRNFPCCFKEPEGDPAGIYSNLLAAVSATQPDLVVLPESAMSEVGAVDGAAALRFALGISRQAGGAAVLAGGGRADAARRLYNSAALYRYGAGGTVREVYDKVHLVPFGEFIPLDKLVPALQKFAPVGSCTPGEPKLLKLAAGGRIVPFGVAICYEDTDSALMRAYARMGARFLCFITNDSWFSDSVEAEAHAWQATVRAVETGLAVARVGNSGVTGTIAPDGSASWLVGTDLRPLVDARGAMADRVAAPASPRLAPYVVLGDRPLKTIFALLILAMIMVKYKHERERRRRLPV